jgi:hypothetical protein
MDLTTRAARRKSKFNKAIQDIKSTWQAYFPTGQKALRPAAGYEYDVLLARRRKEESGVATVTIPEVTIAEHSEETPGGTINGTNTAFTVTNTPSPIASLKLYMDGILLRQTTHYSVSGTAITFVSAFKPITGQTLFAAYRYIV